MFFHAHPNAPVRDGIGRHPNSYFDASMIYKSSNLAGAGMGKENIAAKQLEANKNPAEIHSNTNHEGMGVNGGALNNLTNAKIN
jgi:hypothetical protein